VDSKILVSADEDPCPEKYSECQFKQGMDTCIWREEYEYEIDKDGSKTKTTVKVCTYNKEERFS
jgi:hypothetical protein